MKKFTNGLIAICLLIVICLTGCSKDVNHLYDWLLENGQLKNGTNLDFVQTSKVGLFTLRAIGGGSSTLSVVYTVRDDIYEKDDIKVELPLNTNNKAKAIITITNEDGISCGLEYFHTRQDFTRNTPIEYGNEFSEFDHSKNKVIIEEISMQRRCKELAHSSLCNILDWLNDKVCPEANLKLSHLGYKKYN